MTPEKVREILLNIITEFGFANLKPEAALHMMGYISGLTDMANAVIDEIEEEKE